MTLTQLVALADQHAAAHAQPGSGHPAQQSGPGLMALAAM